MCAEEGQGERGNTREQTRPRTSATWPFIWYRMISSFQTLFLQYFRVESGVSLALFCNMWKGKCYYCPNLKPFGAKSKIKSKMRKTTSCKTSQPKKVFVQKPVLRPVNMEECAPSVSVLNHIPLFHLFIFIAFLFSCLFNFGSSTLFWTFEKILKFSVSIWTSIPKSWKVKTRNIILDM